ncbi:MAG: hypothetical protein IV088_11260 [Hydrogenophaga sp.]|uniref:hypothetical protein n=1 Tax=Hydrogenophaga sp. TaxID=1904254 RepID=UPI0025B844AA|nr:hypothetical protein [Hydrogenophaga sp.]MBT9551420.1 hypothetical protein [Hydrogenophaga sp.]
MPKRPSSASDTLYALSNSLMDSLRDSVQAVLGVEKVVHDQEAVARIRQAMMALHGEAGLDHNPHLHRQIASTQDAEGLWYARAELYADLCQLHDETHAVRSLESLLPLFHGSLPSGLLKTRTPGAGARGPSFAGHWFARRRKR